MVAESPLGFFRPRPEWFDQAACRGMDTNIFFPEPAHMGGADPHAQEAKKVCSRCPVKSECLQYALDPNPMTERYGVWGGLGEKQRRKVRRQRALERAA